MKKKSTIGFVTTVSGRWPKELPEKRHLAYSNWLRDNVEADFVVASEPVSTSAQLQNVIDLFCSQRVDLVILLYGAFSGDDIACALVDEVDVPIVLWAPYEPPFDRDDRLYSNALVALTMNAASLHRLGKHCHVLYGGYEDVRVCSELSALVRAYTLIKNMKGTLFGLFGYRPTSFYNSAFDEGLIRRTFGIRMEEADLKMVFDRMQSLDFSLVEADMRSISEKYDSSKLPDKHLENHSRLYIALKELSDELGYDMSAIKCWPEMGELHTTPCAVLGRLADEGVHIACEGDVDAGLAMMMENYLTGLPVFVTDMIDMNEEENILTYWHCGNPAPSLMDKEDGIGINNHPLVGQGTAFYGVLKPGPVTIARVCNISGVYKLFILSGEAVKSSRSTKGAMVNVRAKTPVREVFRRIIEEGVPHHYSIVWQDVADDLKLTAKLLGIEIIAP